MTLIRAAAIVFIVLIQVFNVAMIAMLLYFGCVRW